MLNFIFLLRDKLGSKSVFCKNIAGTVNIIREQRLNGSRCGDFKASHPYLIGTLTGLFGCNYKNLILTTQLVNKRSYSTSCIDDSRGNNNQKLIIDPHFLTGFADAESSFVLSISKRNEAILGWAVIPRFQIHVHKKDLFVLEAIQDYLGVGKIYAGKDSVEYMVFSIKALKVVIDHFDKYPLISQKYGDYFLFKQAYLLMVNREHLTLEGLRKIISIRASMNNGLTPALKEAFPSIMPAIRPIKENISIYNPQWLAGFTSGEGLFGVKIRKGSGNSKAVVELIYQINQHIRDKELIASLVDYLGCGNIYSHSANAVVYRVSKRSDLTEKIIPFFLKYPILGIKALDFKDFCFILSLTKNNVHHSKVGLNQIVQIKANMNSGRDE